MYHPNIKSSQIYSDDVLTKYKVKPKYTRIDVLTKYKVKPKYARTDVLTKYKVKQSILGSCTNQI